ncbi:PadR family transcriptional regulator [Micromonospora ureilytica]|uniref:PadR family transcriptional regulator n=1 Tax=Micromonospora ureilytica TaxID=709868 RepID=UPI002E13D0B1|nr:PadR family transcriptional regulator [Micromonospora ureilytica]
MGDEPQWPAQWMRGVLELCVLALVGENETYGYEIVQRLKAAGFGQVKGGTLYAILLRLEEDGLIASVWREGVGGPGRKYYMITGAGRAALRSRYDTWAAFVATTSELLTTTGMEAR